VVQRRQNLEFGAHVVQVDDAVLGDHFAHPDFFFVGQWITFYYTRLSPFSYYFFGQKLFSFDIFGVCIYLVFLFHINF